MWNSTDIIIPLGDNITFLVNKWQQNVINNVLDVYWSYSMLTPWTPKVSNCEGILHYNNRRWVNVSWPKTDWKMSLYRSTLHTQTTGLSHTYSSFIPEYLHQIRRSWQVSVFRDPPEPEIRVEELSFNHYSRYRRNNDRSRPACSTILWNDHPDTGSPAIKLHSDDTNSAKGTRARFRDMKPWSVLFHHTGHYQNMVQHLKINTLQCYKFYFIEG